MWSIHALKTSVSCSDRIGLARSARNALPICKKHTVRKCLALLVALTAGIAFFWLILMKVISRLGAGLGVSVPCPSALGVLIDNPVRRKAVPRLLDWIGIQPGDRVFELGPGPGAFTVEAARRAGPTGRLVAIDIQPRMMVQVQARVRKAQVTNVDTSVAAAVSLPLASGCVARAFAVTVLGEISEPDRALAELHRVLAPGGLLSVGEWFVDPDYRFPLETIRQVEAAGFRLAERHGNFWEYTLNFRRVAADAPAGTHRGPSDTCICVGLSE